MSEEQEQPEPQQTIEQVLPTWENANKVAKQLELTEAAYKDVLDSYHKQQDEIKKLKEKIAALESGIAKGVSNVVDVDVKEVAKNVSDVVAHEQYLADRIESCYFEIPIEKYESLDRFKDRFPKKYMYMAFDRNFKYLKTISDVELEQMEQSL